MTLLLAIACSGDPPADGPADLEPSTTETGTTSTADTSAPPGERCELTDHPLRVRCTVPGAVLTAPGAPERTDDDGLVWGLKPETTYTWTVAGDTGTVTTGPLPKPLADLDVSITGTAAGFDAVVQAVDCGGTSWAVAIDGGGDVVWFEDLGVPLLMGYDWSDADRSFLAMTQEAVFEVAWDGSRPLELRQGVHYAGPAHHDVHRWGPYTYVLQAASVRGSDGLDYVVDTVEVFDGTTSVGLVSLADLYDPGSIPSAAEDGFWDGLFPGHFDWSHGNSVTVEDGELLLSLRWLDSALALDGDPTSPTFGQRRWLAVGSSLSLPAPDYVGAFEGQHHVTRAGDQLWMFDNRAQGVPSRGLRLALDDVAATAGVDAAWVLDAHCPILGTVYPLDGGGALVTCSTRAQVQAFSDGAAAPDWTMTATCSAFSQTARAVPITF